MNKIKDILDRIKKEQHELQYVTLADGTKKHATEFEDKSVGSTLHSELRMNSYAREVFIRKLDNETFIETAYHYMNNCSPRRYPASTYDEAVIHVILPELLKRFEEVIGGVTYIKNK